MRYEHKFILNPLNTQSINIFLKQNSFVEHHRDRTVNSIYYDTNDLILYQDSLNGICNRKKIRCRFYNKNSHFNLEYKVKVDNINLKLNPEYNKKNLIWLNNRNQKAISEKLFLPKNIESQFIPKVFISYKRTYLISRKNSTRITLDTCLRFSRLINYSDSIKILPSYKSCDHILEIKYDHKIIPMMDILEDLTNRFGLILTKFSKYTTAINTIFD